MDRGEVYSKGIASGDIATRLLDRLDNLKTSFSPNDANRVRALLARTSKQAFRDAESLIRFHELLLFLRAYPHNAAVARAAEAQLRTFPKRISELRERDVDLSRLEHPDVSGIAGTSVTDTFSYYIVRWLVQHYPTQLEIYWDWFEDENRLGETWPRFMPLLEEDTMVEANVPYREWLAAARDGRSELSWLIERFNELKLADKEKAELYDSQKLYVTWTPRFHSTRTGMRIGRLIAGTAGVSPATHRGARFASKQARRLRSQERGLFFHRGPFIQRRDINLRQELEQPSPPLRKLSQRDGEKALDLAREASTVRYRELYGFTHGDPRHVYQTELGRGVELFVMGLPPGKRLPLRAYHAAMIYKNGVPIGYFEGLSLFERMESGFNLYYTFRDGETAWLYARVLNVMRHFAGVTAFSIDPYQIGYENEEGIESGAFWFYRKLGFRPTKRDVLALVRREEEKIAIRKRYRTSARTLRKLAESPMIFELESQRTGDWDRFEVRQIGMMMQGREFKFPNTIVRAKESAEEISYLKLMRQHERLRSEIIGLGSTSRSGSPKS